VPALYDHRPLPEVFSSKRKKWWHTDRLLGTSSRKERAIWYIGSQQELWSQRYSHC
jgi:hypothetical protein